MHRSGTSALTRVLNLLGLEIGNVNTENRHWEQSGIKQLNDEILARAHGSWQWTDPGNLERVLEDLPPAFSDRAARIVADLDARGSWVAKDPRFCLTLPFWQAQLGKDRLIVVLTYRHPLEVAMSLQKRDQLPIAAGLALWELYTLSALRHSAHTQRLWVAHTEVIHRPLEMAKRLLGEIQGLGVDGLGLSREAEIAEFISTDRYRQRANQETRNQRLTQNQLKLVQAFERGELPSLDVNAPFADMSDDVLRMHARLLTLESEVRAKHTIIDAIRAKAAQRDEETAAMRVHLRQRETQFAQQELHLRNELQEAQKRAQKAKTARANERKALDAYMKERTELLAHIETQTRRIGELEMRCWDAELRAEAWSEERKRARVEQDRRTSEAAQRAAQQRQLELQHANTSRELERVGAELASVRASSSTQAADWAAALHAVATERDRLKHESANQLAHMEQQRAELADKVARLQDKLEREVEARRRSVFLAEAKRRKLTQSRDEIAHRAELQKALKSKVRHLERELKQRRSALELATHEVERARALVSGLQSSAAEREKRGGRSPLGRLANAARGISRTFGDAATEQGLGAAIDALVQWRDAVERILPDAAKRVHSADAVDEVSAVSSDSVTRQPEPELPRSADLDGTGGSLHVAGAILRTFQAQLYNRWTGAAGLPYSGMDRLPKPKVMIGTLHSGENEFERCKESIARQSYENITRRVFSGLGKKEAVATLMETFQQSDCEILIKIDADMVLLSESFVERVVEVFLANPGVTLCQMAILDFFSGGPMQGINAYRKSVNWRTSNQDRLFTDKTRVPASERLVVWSTFCRDAIHSPDPSPFQAFHFGVHRGIKVLQPLSDKYEVDRAEEQLAYLEQTWEHFTCRKDRRLVLACLGFELAIAGRFSVEHLDYTNPRLREEFEPFNRMQMDELAGLLLKLRDSRVSCRNTEGVRARRAQILSRQQDRVGTVLALLPHVGVFGGVNRFFELARSFRALGVDLAIAIPDAEIDPKARKRIRHRPEYTDVEVLAYSRALSMSWDVVLCGDAFGGVMLTLPLFDAKTVAVYLLNGWMHNPLNVAQVELVEPDVVVANSSYTAAQFRGLAPTPIPGGINLNVFFPSSQARIRNGGNFKICVYPGRRKPRKRFDDALTACELLHRQGIPIELHTYDQETLRLDTPYPFMFHGALGPDGIRELLWSTDAMICAEEDAGWSNPAAEAMACGTNLVCTDAGTTDFALDGVTAYVVPRRDPAAIAHAIAKLYQSPDTALALRNAGIARMKAFGWMNVARGLLDTFNAARLDRDARVRRNKRLLERYRKQGLVHVVRGKYGDTTS